MSPSQFHTVTGAMSTMSSPSHGLALGMSCLQKEPECTILSLQKHMASSNRTYSRTVRHACELLGTEIRQARIERRWSIRELAERGGVTPRTVVRVERGDPVVGIGIVLDLAVLCGVSLFGTDRAGIDRALAAGRDRLALLPAAARRPRASDDDDF